MHPGYPLTWNGLVCVLNGGLLSIILLLINVLTDIPKFSAIEWTAATIAGAMLLPKIRWRYYNLAN